MATHQDINMEPDGVLLALCHLVGNTWVMWIEYKSTPFQILLENGVPKQRCNEYPMQGIECCNMQCFHAVLVDDVGQVTFLP